VDVDPEDGPFGKGVGLRLSFYTEDEALKRQPRMVIDFALDKARRQLIEALAPKVSMAVDSHDDVPPISGGNCAGRDDVKQERNFDPWQSHDKR
jgi:hypothetical protein